MTPPVDDDRRLVGAARHEAQAAGVSPATGSDFGERPGDVIHRYTLIEPLGEGGMGTVWLARQSEPVAREVALKIVKLGMDTREVVVRFEAERQALALMEHPGIAKVLDGGATDSGRPFFVMERVTGGRITDHCDRERLDLRARLRLFVEVCEAVHYAHQKGIIHRDLKPGNVLMTSSGEESSPKVIDFGIAKATGAQLTEKTLFTSGTQALGTPEYMAPEQAAMSTLDIDTRVDIYSLGVLLYELLTGSKPFELDVSSPGGIEALLKQVQDTDPRRPSTRVTELDSHVASDRASTETALRRALHGDLDWIVLRALEKDRDRRYASAHDFAEDIQRFLAHEPVEAVPPSATYRLRKLVRRRRKAIAASLALLILLVAGSVGTGIGWWNTRQTNQALEQALGEKSVALEEKEAALREKERALEEEEAALRVAEDARAAEVEQRELAQSEAERAQAEAERAQLAETAAERRTAELELISAFESEQLQAVDVASMGLGMRGRLIDAVPEERQPTLRTALEGVNFTSFAVDTLRLELLDNTLSAIRAGFVDQPELQARLLSSHAASRSALGLPGEARPLHQEVVELWTQARGPEDLLTLAAITDLASATLATGDAAKAMRLLEANLDALNQGFGAEHPESLRAFDLTGGVAYGLGDMQRAERVMREGVERRLQAGANDDPDTWAAIKGLSVATRAVGKSSEALELSELALDGLRRTLPQDHPQLVGAIHSHASMLAYAQRFDESELLMREALESEFRARGALHPAALAAQENLAILVGQLGRQEESEEMLLSCLAGFREALGEEHPETLECMGTLAALLHRRGRSQEAKALLDAAMTVQVRLLGEDHPDVLQSKSVLADAVRGTGDRAAAELLYRELIDDMCRVKGTGHNDATGAVRSLTSFLFADERWDDIETLLRETLQRRIDDLGPDDRATNWSRQELAGYLNSRGRSAEAQALFEG